MTQQEKEKLIAEYMGIPQFMPKTNHPNVVIFDMTAPVVEELKFTTSLDWIELVLEKILSQGSIININVDLNKRYSWILGTPDIGMYSLLPHFSSKIEATIDAIVQYIQWYNEQKK